MSDAAGRLRQAREAAGFVTAADAARALGVAYPTYAAHENASRGFLDRLDHYARRLGVRAEWLRNGTGPMKPEQRDPMLVALEELTPQQRSEVYQFVEFLRRRRPSL